MKSKYLQIQKIEDKPKTSVYECRNKMTGDKLGIIKWYPPFRKYSFFSEPNIVYDAKCLEDITDFIKELSTYQVDKRNSHGVGETRFRIKCGMAVGVVVDAGVIKKNKGNRR